MSFVFFSRALICNSANLSFLVKLMVCVKLPYKVSELGAYRMLVEEAHDLISAHSTDVNAVFTFASGGFDRLLGMDPSVSMKKKSRNCVSVFHNKAFILVKNDFIMFMCVARGGWLVYQWHQVNAVPILICF